MQEAFDRAESEAEKPKPTIIERLFSAPGGYEQYLCAVADQPYTARRGCVRAETRSVANLARTAKARLDYGYRHTNILRTEAQIEGFGGKVIAVYRSKGIWQATGPDSGALMWPDEAITRADGERGERFNPARFRNRPRRFDLADPAQRAEFASACDGLTDEIDGLSEAAGWVLSRRYGLDRDRPTPAPPTGGAAELEEWCESLGREIADLCWRIDAKLSEMRRERISAERAKEEGEVLAEVLTEEAAKQPSADPVEPTMPKEYIITPEDVLRLDPEELAEKMAKQDKWLRSHGKPVVGQVAAPAPVQGLGAQ